MVLSKQKKKNLKNVLVLTASGGGGLLQAARAKRQELRAINPNINLFTIDVMMLSLTGVLGVNIFNFLQKKGDVANQENLVKHQYISDILFWPRTFFYVLFKLFRKDIDHVIDTQVLVTSAIVKAIRVFNKLKSKKVFLEKVFVDLPTKECQHFFKNVRKLSKSDKNNVYVSTTIPLLEKDQTEEKFWQKHLLMPKNKIVYEYPLRKHFVNFEKQDFKKKEYFLKIETFNEKEKEISEMTFSRGFENYKILENSFEFKILPKDKVITLLLGSQPTYHSVLKYVDEFEKLAKKIKTNIYVYIFCSSSTAKKNSLFLAVSEKVKISKNFPKNLIVVPLSKQRDEIVAPIMYRSNITITRAGGQTIMELLKLCSGISFIHSETKGINMENYDMQKVMKGVVDWEAYNALYLVNKNRGKFVTTDVFAEMAYPYLTK